MPRARLSQQERKARTRKALVAAAVRLFARRGIEATSLDQVAEAAGYTKGAIYANFPNKRALINAVVAEPVVIDPSPLLRADLPLADRLALVGREVVALQQRVSREVVMIDLEYSLDALRNPRARRAWQGQVNTEWADLPARLDALNQTQGANPPFQATKLLKLAALLIRGILRELAERPGTLTPEDIEQAFRMLAGADVH